MLTILVAVATTAANAEAGMLCLEKKDFTDAAADLETFAAKKLSAIETTSEVCLRIAFADKKWAFIHPRIEKACAKILERDGDSALLCVELAVRLGKTELGGVKLLDAAIAYPMNPFDWDRFTPMLWVIGTLGEARGATHVIEVWTANLDKAKKWEKRSSAMQAWAGWRKEAADAIGKAGLISDEAFLKKQIAATKDRYVKKALLAALSQLIDRWPDQVQ